MRLTYKDLANELGVSEQAIKQYPKVKRELMMLGLKSKSASLSLIEKEIIEIGIKVDRLDAELKEWEKYNAKENDISREEIAGLKKLMIKFVKLNKNKSFTI